MVNDDTHAFMIRIWVEERRSAGRPPVWRGHITHSMSGTQRYISELSDVTAFMRLYLEGAGDAIEAPMGRRRSEFMQRIVGIFRRM
jgi:hypothetical protein